MTFRRRSGQKFREYWTRADMVLNILLLLLRGKDKMTMAIIYATLIIKGKKRFLDVPLTLREQVRQILIDLECEDLIIE